MNIVCIIQARTTSSRLPNKVLLNLPYGSEKTVLENVIERIKKSKYVNEIIIATTTNETDDLIEKTASKAAVKCFRGSEDNVLSRYYFAASESKADIIIRVTSDCPCIDPDILDQLIEKHLAENNDYTSNTLKRTYPHGLDCEVFNFSLLKEAYKNAKDVFEKEHVTPYIYKTNSNKFKIGIMEAQEDNHKIRITLDTKKDYTLMCVVYDYLYEENEIFKTASIVKLFKSKSWLYEINSDISQKKVCKNLNEEIEEGIKLLEKQDLFRAKEYLKEKFYGEKR